MPAVNHRHADPTSVGMNVEQALSDSPEQTAKCWGVLDQFRQAADFTRELFPGGLGVIVEEDPEISGDFRIVLQVKATGTCEQIIEQELEWCRRLSRLNVPCVFRLSIDAQE